MIFQSFLPKDPDDKTHAIKVYDPLNSNEPLIIPLVLKGVTSYFPSRNPRTSEYEDYSILHIEITSEAPVWEPSETGFLKQEYTMTDFSREVISGEIIAKLRRIINSLSTIKDHVVDFTDDKNIYKSLNDKVNGDKVGSSKGIHVVTS